MRPLLIALLLILPACVPNAASRPASPSERPATVLPEQVPDLSGEWHLGSKEGAFAEIWTIEQVGNALTGTIVYDPAALPAGFANAPRDLYGQLIDNGGTWLALLQTPDGTLRVDSDQQFSFCLKNGSTCRTGLKRLRR